MKTEKRTRNLKSDPLFIIGAIVLIVGAVLLVYGLIPQQRASYTFLAAMHVPVNDSQGNFILAPESYFTQHYTGPGSVDKVICAVATGGWQCYGYQFSRMETVFNTSLQEYGLLMLGLGLIPILAAVRLGPSKPTEVIPRPINIRVDEDICVANGVCVELAPTVFQFKDQKTPTIFAPMAYVVDPNSADYFTILNAAQMCPTKAIIIEDAETGEVIHPPPPKS